MNPPTANYPQSARDVDAFVYEHPDMLVVFNTGNFGSNGAPPASTLSAPGSAKNTLQVGGTRGYANRGDQTLAGYSLIGPTRDGRIKPDVVGPAYVRAADAKFLRDVECDITDQGGTSWASPSIAGAAALVRQYYLEGFYPAGARGGTPIAPSAALLKATIIASARPAVNRTFASGPDMAAQPVPSHEQGFGFPVLDDALYFGGDRTRLRVADVADDQGLAEGGQAALTLNVRSGSRLRAVLVWTDPPGVVRPVSDPTPQLVNDLDLRVTSPGGDVLFGNESLHPREADRHNNVEVVTVETPATGTYSVTISAARLGFGLRQGYALVVTGDFEERKPTRIRAVRR
jgi:hypothetical protein